MFARKIPRELLRAQARVLVDAVDSGVDVTYSLRKGARSAEGDPMRLRGIPVVGRNIGGAVPGTRPGA